MQVVQQPKNPTLAAILSFLIPGLGQIYNGEVGKGVMVFIVQIINFALAVIFIGIFTGLIVMVWAIYDAYKVAERINQQFAAQYMAQYGAGAAYSQGQLNPQMGQFPPYGQPVQPPVSSPAPLGQLLPLDMKKCPQCAESVKVEAKACRYCGHLFAASGPMP